MKKYFLFIMAAVLFLAVTNNDCYGQGVGKKAGKSIINLIKGEIGGGYHGREIKILFESPVTVSHTYPGGYYFPHIDLPKAEPFKPHQHVQLTTPSTFNSRERVLMSATISLNKQRQETFMYLDPYMLPMKTKAEDAVVVSVSADKNKIVASTSKGVALEVETQTCIEGWRHEKKKKQTKEKEKDIVPSDIKIPIPPLCLDCKCPTGLYDME